MQVSNTPWSEYFKKTSVDGDGRGRTMDRKLTGFLQVIAILQIIHYYCKMIIVTLHIIMTKIKWNIVLLLLLIILMRILPLLMLAIIIYSYYYFCYCLYCWHCCQPAEQTPCVRVCASVLGDDGSEEPRGPHSACTAALILADSPPITFEGFDAICPLR